MLNMFDEHEKQIPYRSEIMKLNSVSFIRKKGAQKSRLLNIASDCRLNEVFFTKFLPIFPLIRISDFMCFTLRHMSDAPRWKLCNLRIKLTFSIIQFIKYQIILWSRISVIHEGISQQTTACGQEEGYSPVPLPHYR